MSIEERLARLEACAEIRHCMTRYMQICDDLHAQTDLAALGGLFTADAVWEGSGSRYGKDFGRHVGRDAIVDYFRLYCGVPPHFSSNHHFLTSESIAVEGDKDGKGRWMMVQTPTFHDGSSFLMSAIVEANFRSEDGLWRIARFRTTNLFARPMAPWNQPVQVPAPPNKGRQY